jgi:hypothetical protein
MGAGGPRWAPQIVMISPGLICPLAAPVVALPVTATIFGGIAFGGASAEDCSTVATLAGPGHYERPRKIDRQASTDALAGSDIASRDGDPLHITTEAEDGFEAPATIETGTRVKIAVASLPVTPLASVTMLPTYALLSTRSSSAV